MRETDPETLSDLAMIAWVKRKEKRKERQPRKSIVVDPDNEYDADGGNKFDGGGNGKKSLRQSGRESKRDLCSMTVGDAAAMVGMEVVVEKLATKEARAEDRARRNLTKKQKKKGLKMVIIVGKAPGMFFVEQEPEAEQKVCGKGKGNRKGKANPTLMSKSKSKSKSKGKNRGSRK